MSSATRRHRHCPINVIVAVLLMMLLQLVSQGMVDAIKAETAKDDGGVASINLSEEAAASIFDLDDHPVEDTDADRADRMLAALAGIPEAERLGMGLDIEAMRAIPLEERLVKLEELWTMRQQELREAYDALPKVNELLTARIEVMRDEGASETALELVLTDLEDLLSDIDMARDFHSIGGFPTLASMLHVSRPEAVREVAAWAIGTAVKNENAHQLWVLEDGPESQLSALALMLENAALASTCSLRSKIVYALSASLSNNADVQLQFGSLRGERVLSAMYDADSSDNRVKTKIVLLLSDLLQEAARGSPAAALATLPVGSTVTSGGVWCNRVDELLQQASSPVTLEKALEAVVSLAPSCRSQFLALETKQRLDTLAHQCRTSPPVGLEDDEVEFHEELADKLEKCAAALR